jgi:hypothetical protein
MSASSGLSATAEVAAEVARLEVTPKTQVEEAAAEAQWRGPVFLLTLYRQL